MRRSIVASSLPLLAVMMTLAACTTGPAARSSPTPAPSSWPVVTWHGGGTASAPVAHPLPVPAGARSVRIVVSCTGTGDVGVSLPAPAELSDPRYGACRDVHEWAYPVRGSTTEYLQVSAASGSRYVVEARFERSALVSDPEIRVDCRAFSKVAGLIADADAGVQPQFAAFDAAGWRSRVDDAARLARSDASASTGPLKTVLGLAADELAVQDIPVGQATAIPARTTIAARCDVNETPLQVSVHYGG